MIPVIIHHETNAKPQTGGKKNQEYLKYCIEQAQKYNEKVVLIGNENNREWCREWHDVKEFPSEKWDRFLEVFENLSTYPDSWAQSIFKRFFLIEEYLKANHYTEFILLDSDVLVYLDFSKYPYFKDIDVALEMEKNQDVDCMPAGNGMRMTAGAGIAYFTLEALESFTDFCIETYAHNRARIDAKWAAHQKYGMPGGVAEMAILYLWQETLPRERVLNLLIERDQTVFDDSTSGETNYVAGEFKVSRLTRIKKFGFDGDRPYFIRKSDGSRQYVNNLHFVGADKIYLETIYKNKRVTIKPLLTKWYWIARGFAGGIKRSIFK